MKSNRINSLTINTFRGIKDLELKGFGDLNVILGDNNSGKTTVLEAIRLFRKHDLANVIDTLKDRKEQPVSYNDFLYLFNTADNKIDISIDSYIGKERLYIDYTQKKTVFSENMFLYDRSENEVINKYFSFLIKTNELEGKEVPQINGVFKTNEKTIDYSLLPLDFSLGRLHESDDEEYIKVVYESPSNHFKLDGSLISAIKENEEYYRIFIEVLRLFDESINKVELLTSRNYSLSMDLPEIYIQCGNSDPMPLSIYGDGIKKVMCIAAMVARAKDGILLIDEIETSLHHKYYEDVFYFLVKVAKKFNIQLFATTHSKEIVDVFSNYNLDNKTKSNIQFYTLKKSGDKTVCRVANDEKAKHLKKLGLEVRG